MIKDLFRPVLSDRTIMKYNKKGLLIKDPIPPTQLQPNSVDLTLADSYKRIVPNEYGSGNQFGSGGVVVGCIDPLEEIKYEPGIFEESVIIRPGEFLLLASNEILNIPNGILSFVQGRSSIARMGIQTEQAGLIDAGFRGTITFEVFNETGYPIKLYKGMRVAQVYFFKSQYAITAYGKLGLGSKYHDQMLATGSRIHRDHELDKYRR